MCAGIEAASVAWLPLGWTPAWYSEIDLHACSVLKERHPEVPNLGDMTKLKGEDLEPVELLVGGTPCQSFSVAGLRKGLDDDRGNLAFEFCRIASELRPQWIVWENVPGVLSLDKGRAFGSILGALADIGYGFAYRILDAQWMRVQSHPRAVPQRRRRVFVVGHLGDWRRAAAVLLERESLQGHSTPRREAGKAVAALTATGVGTCGADDNQAQHGHIIPFDTTQITSPANRSHPKPGDPCHPLAAGAHPPSIAPALTGNPYGDHESREGLLIADCVPFDTSQIARDGSCNPGPGDPMHPIRSGKHPPAIATGASTVRRITPREAERLQGFPDNYTLVEHRGKPMADSPRYRLLGNSMAVNVMRWIGERIQMVDDILTEQENG